MNAGTCARKPITAAISAGDFMITRTQMGILLGCLLTFWLNPSIGHAVMIYAPDISVKSGDAVTVPVMIDDVDNLAGLKLVITYDDKVLTYIGGSKTPVSTSLMHIVNDRKSGRLVLVMAGARGIHGKNVNVFEFRFTAAAEINKKTLTELRIVESQLMSDALKDLKHENKPFRVAITPAETPPAVSTPKK